MNYKVVYKVKNIEMILNIKGLSKNSTVNALLNTIDFFGKCREYFGSDSTFNLLSSVSFDDGDNEIDSSSDTFDFSCVGTLIDTRDVGSPKPMTLTGVANSFKGVDNLPSFSDVVSEITTGYDYTYGWRFKMLSITIELHKGEE